MHNLLSYCGLVDAKIRASDIDLPVFRERIYHVFKQIEILKITMVHISNFSNEKMSCLTSHAVVIIALV